MLPAPTIRCPSCGQTDAVRKVSVIVNEGTRITTRSGTASVPVPYDPDDPISLLPATVQTHSTEIQQTTLALLLDLPPAPRPPYKPSRFFRYLLAMCMGGGTLICSGMASLACVWTYKQPNIPWWLIGCLCASTSGTGIAFLVNGLLRWLSTAERTYPAQWQAYQTQYQAWEAKRRAWHKTYYCFRCQRQFLVLD